MQGPFTAFRPDTGERGFSLSEALVALVLTSLVFVAALTLLDFDQKLYNKDDAVLEIDREARHALDTLQRDLVMAGYQVDRQTIADVGADGTANTGDDLVGQGKIVYAAPWEIAINADIDPNIAAIKSGETGATLPDGYSPVTFHTGAETILYTLDSNGDGSLTAADRGDEVEEQTVANNGLYLLRCAVYGFNGTSNVNSAGPVALVRGPVAYPNGAQPVPLFLYWGNFYNRAGLTLWGDNGAGGGTAGNGVLEPGELAALGPVTAEDANGNGVLDAGEDRNGNGVLDRTISSLIKKVELHVTTETPYADQNYRDAARSSSTSPFRYRAVTLSADVQPRNMDLAGGNCGAVPLPVASPTIVNECSNPRAEGKARLSWTLSGDDGAGEMDIAKYEIYRTDVNSMFSSTPFGEVSKNVATWVDNRIELRTWPPRQYWYRVRSMDCTPQLSVTDPIAGPYPAHLGPSYPTNIAVAPPAGGSGNSIRVDFDASPDDPSNTTGYGGAVSSYFIYRSDQPDYSCIAPINNDPVGATGAASYAYSDDAAHSSTAPVLGTLYYYWLRSEDAASDMSPYSPRYCARAFAGPAYPAERNVRVASYASNDHPVEVWFARNKANTDAGYHDYSLQYRIYGARDTDGDGHPNSLVDDSVGYRTIDLRATLSWRGLVWAVGGSTPNAYHSIDGGGTWRRKTGSGNTMVGVSFASRLLGIAVGRGGAVAYTSNGGVSWVSGTSGTTRDLAAVAFPSESLAVAVGESGTVIRSTDGGATWTAVTTATSQDFRGVAAVGSTVFAVGRGGTAVRSDDAGQNFTSLTFTTSDLQSVAAFDDGGGITVLAGDVDRIWRSTNGGSSWSAISIPGGGTFNGVACAELGNALAVASDTGRVYGTTDGATWTAIPVGASAPNAVAMLDRNMAWVADGSGKVYHRDAFGTWSNTTVPGSVALYGLAVRPEIAWEDSTTANASSGRQFYYVVTSYYHQSSSLDGESGMLPDRPATQESPDDTYDQVLVDSCNNTELTATIP